jgi:hypothetical protein
MKLTPDSSRDPFQYKSMSSMQRYAPIFRSSKYDPKYLFLNQIASSDVQFIQDSATLSMSYFTAVNFKSKLTLNSHESIQQFREQ